MPDQAENADKEWFRRFPTRKVRIRSPAMGEATDEFRSLGPHEPSRRRMIVIRVPDGQFRGTLMRIPFLAFADETIEDSDEVLLPIVHGIMLDARKANDK